MKCKKHAECGREAYWLPTGLCLFHEKRRRKYSRRKPETSDQDDTNTEE